MGSRKAVSEVLFLVREAMGGSADSFLNQSVTACIASEIGLPPGTCGCLRGVTEESAAGSC